MLCLNAHYHGNRIYLKLRVCINYISMVFTCSPLHLFSYPVPAGDQGSVQHLTLWGVPVDIFIKVLSLFSEVTELKCHSIRPPQKVQCVHMYSVAWDALVFCIHQSLFESVLIMDVFCPAEN